MAYLLPRLLLRLEELLPDELLLPDDDPLLELPLETLEPEERAGADGRACELLGLLDAGRACWPVGRAAGRAAGRACCPEGRVAAGRACCPAGRVAAGLACCPAGRRAAGRACWPDAGRVLFVGLVVALGRVVVARPFVRVVAVGRADLVLVLPTAVPRVAVLVLRVARTASPVPRVDTMRPLLSRTTALREEAVAFRPPVLVLRVLAVRVLARR